VYQRQGRHALGLSNQRSPGPSSGLAHQPGWGLLILKDAFKKGFMIEMI
jgi:hypothetical protein